MNPDKVLGIKNAVLVLSSSVHDFCSEVLSFVSDGLAKGVLDRRVVAVYEETIYKLYR